MRSKTAKMRKSQRELGPPHPLEEKTRTFQEWMLDGEPFLTINGTEVMEGDFCIRDIVKSPDPTFAQMIEAMTKAHHLFIEAGGKPMDSFFSSGTRVPDDDGDEQEVEEEFED